jgi:hypothetical protein
VSACKATGYAREGLPLCDGARNAVARAPEYKRNGTGRGRSDKARVQVKVEVAVGRLTGVVKSAVAGVRRTSCGRR